MTATDSLNPPVTGVILAGGQGSRMGGEDKGWVHLDGKPLIEHVIERLKPQVKDIVIVANRHLQEYAQLGFPVVEDHLKGFQGPLAGIHSALCHLSTELALVVPIDAPFLPADLLKRLLAAASDVNAINHPLLCHDGERQQPLFGLYPKNACASLEDFLNKGDRKLMRWCADNNAQWVDCSSVRDTFANLNTPQDLVQAKKS